MPLNAILLLKLFGLIAVANTIPLIVSRIFRRRLAFPLDGNLNFTDGRPLFGPAKTIRGLLLSILSTAGAALIMDMRAMIGALIAAGAMIGDLFSSFVKRRLRIAPSAPAVGLDQIPESLLPLLLVQPFLPLSLVEIAIVVAVFLIAEIVIARVLHSVHLRERPY